MKKEFLAVATNLIDSKINGSIGVEMLFATATLFGILYFLQKMDPLIILSIDFKPILQLIAICGLFLIYAYLFIAGVTIYRKKL